MSFFDELKRRNAFKDGIQIEPNSLCRPGLDHRRPGLDPGSILDSSSLIEKWIPGQARKDGSN
jgi:hypothetical protein